MAKNVAAVFRNIFFKEAHFMAKISPVTIKKHLYDSIDYLFQNKEKYLSDSNRAFSRTQKISFRDGMIFPMITGSESTSIEMLDYFSIENLPSQAAMSYRRDQINLSAFTDLFMDFTNKLPLDKNYHGMRFIACDGTRINTPYNPSDKDSFVNSIENRKGFNQYHLNSCYDILNDVYTDAIIQGYYAMNEKRAFCDMIDRFPKDTQALFTADRGYASFNIIAHIINSGHRFVIRLTAPMAKNLFSDRKDISYLDEFDIKDDIHLGRTRTRENRALRNYHFISSSKVYDYIPKGSKCIDHFTVRLVKFALSGGEYEYLLTNLAESEFTLFDIKKIYEMRWNVETSFRYLKYSADMISIHSLKPKFIFQEIFAKLIAYNFCSAVEKGLEEPPKGKNTKYQYVYEKSYLIKLCIKYLKGKLDNIITLIKKRKVPIRADRKYERNIRRQHADTLQYR